MEDGGRRSENEAVGNFLSFALFLLRLPLNPKPLAEKSLF